MTVIVFLLVVFLFTLIYISSHTLFHLKTTLAIAYLLIYIISFMCLIHIYNAFCSIACDNADNDAAKNNACINITLKMLSTLPELMCISTFFSLLQKITLQQLQKKLRYALMEMNSHMVLELKVLSSCLHRMVLLLQLNFWELHCIK